MGFKRALAQVEFLIKGVAFDCRRCGQCILRDTALICPMTCPKGLRNGPCGGTLDGKCEVHPDRPCVWVRIYERTDKGDTPQLFPMTDAQLYDTSSYLNFLAGTDKVGRTPLKYLDLGTHRTRQPLRTPSPLEQRLKSGRFVKTCEVRAPRTAKLDGMITQALLVREAFDAVNATAFLNGKPSLPSVMAAAKLAALGIDAISQATCRDHTRTSFISELVQAQLTSVHNVLCLTGDYYRGSPTMPQVFDMDASQMIYEARHLRETGVIHFSGDKMPTPPKPFLGGAINPYTDPVSVPVRRLKQKVAAGVDFIQTQLIFDAPRFRRFMESVQQERLDQEVFILAGVPVVTSSGALQALPKIPGVHVPPEVLSRLSGATDIKKAGVALAREIVAELRTIAGVAGVHLMLFGPDHAVLPEIVSDLPAQRADWPRETDESMPPASGGEADITMQRKETAPCR